MRSSKTNLSVIDNTGARVLPKIIVGDGGEYKSGDILDANAVISEINKKPLDGNIYIMYDDDLETFRFVKDKILRDKNHRWVNITYDEYSDILQSVLEGNSIFATTVGYQKIGHVTVPYIDGTKYLLLVHDYDLYFRAYDGNTSLIYEEEPPIELTVEYNEISFLVESLLDYWESVNSWLEENPNTEIYCLKRDGEFIPKETYWNLLDDISNDYITADVIIDNNHKYNLEYLNDIDMLVSRGDSKWYLYIPYYNATVYDAVLAENQELLKQQYSSWVLDCPNTTFYYLKLDDQMISDSSNPTYYDLCGDLNGIDVKVGNTINKAGYQQDPRIDNLVTGFIDDLTKSFVYIPYES